MKYPALPAYLILLLSLIAAPAAGEDQPDPEQSSDQPPHTEQEEDEQPGLTLAVVGFDSRDPSNEDLGGQIAEALTVMLSGGSDFRMVDRQTLRRSLEEQQLSLTGLVDQQEAVRIGHLVGARIIITGRAFRLGEQLFLTAKLIGTETTLVEGVMVKEPTDADLGTMVAELSKKIRQRIREKGPELTASPDRRFDIEAELREKLADRRKPTIAVLITEQHHAQRRRQRTVDPAAETELKRLLIDAGFTVRDIPGNELAEAADDWDPKRVGTWPRSLRDVDMLIVGEAFSESASRIGELVSVAARAEINVIRRSDGRIVHADRATVRAVDLAERIASKKSLEKAGRRLGIDLLRHFAQILPQEEAPDAPDEG